ncbi:sulfate transporter [Thalassotalea loyana]|uniref:Sulfate transporter n=1 Tax=Thalassotalea loyana TaxID=280483 RepID=A0ABQ6HDY7_9GAMM|nr:DUF3164 family protein [Thalassotalea loyana]GLX86337.1 sulfate transporter [Thalassotalea loyana]
MSEQKQEERIFINPQGYKVPESDMQPQVVLCDELVNECIAKALELSMLVDQFKRDTYRKVHDYIALVAAEYNCEINTEKGNMTFTSFDGKKSIVIGISDNISFGVEIDVAKQLINELVKEELGESSSELLRQVVVDAFQADKQGNYNKNSILALRKFRHASKNPKWKEAMRAIDDGIISGTSKTYVRFYQKNEWGKKVQIPLTSTSL